MHVEHPSGARTAYGRSGPADHPAHRAEDLGGRALVADHGARRVYGQREEEHDKGARYITCVWHFVYVVHIAAVVILCSVREAV